ncbi:MAG TPA: ABC transporter permease [Acidimicrobiales bacterium]|nr:ABC transporter permease [Acidimicrobiales bacterium]
MSELDTASVTEEQRSQRSGLGTLLVKHRAGLIGGLILLVFVILAVGAPLFAPFSTTTASGGVFAPPSARHWLGTNDGGIDMLSLLIQGGRISMLVGFAAALVAAIPGALVGILSGYFGGAVDTVLMRITDFFLVIPVIPVMIVIAAVWGPSLLHLIIAIGVLLWTSTARVLRAQVKTLRQRTFVRRAVNLGASRTRVMTRHILPHVAPLLIAQTVVTMALAIFYETALAFLGLGDPTAVSWGTIIEDAFLRTAISTGAWWAIVPPGLCVALVVISAYLVGQSIEEGLNPRLRVANIAPRSWRVRPLVGRGTEAL